jgi:putative ABC transport system ATP-binding protein
MLRLEHVRKVFRQGQTELRALDDVSLEVPRGEFLSVMGPSGSGKSTMLYLMAGLDEPTAGEIFIDGRSLSGLKDDEITLLRRRQIGFVFQFFNLLPTLTAEENVALPLLLDGRSMRTVREPVRALLELVGLGHRRSQRPTEMSGGEMQRVAIARALAIEPVLLLADEPTGNLDTETGRGILELIKRITAERELTVVLVTHDANAARYGDRTITMRDGRLTHA